MADRKVLHSRVPHRFNNVFMTRQRVCAVLLRGLSVGIFGEFVAVFARIVEHALTFKSKFFLFFQTYRGVAFRVVCVCFCVSVCVCVYVLITTHNNGGAFGPHFERYAVSVLGIHHQSAQLHMLLVAFN